MTSTASHECENYQYHMLESGREGAGKVHPRNMSFLDKPEVGMAARKHSERKAQTTQNSPSNSRRQESPELTIKDRIHYPS